MRRRILVSHEPTECFEAVGLLGMLNAKARQGQGRAGLHIACSDPAGQRPIYDDLHDGAQSSTESGDPGTPPDASKS